MYNAVKKDSVNTIGMEFGTRIIHIADKSIKLQIWDTAGQVKHMLYRVCFIIYSTCHYLGTISITNKKLLSRCCRSISCL